MVINNSYNMSEGSKSRIRNFLSFDGKNLLAGVGLLAIMLVAGSFAVAQSGGTPDVAVNSEGVTINTGSLDVNGNDIEDAGTTIFDASSGALASGVLPSSIDASSLDGNTLSQVRAGVTSSDVGLGNVLNKEQIAIDGSNSMNEDLDVGGNGISNIGDSANFDSFGNLNNVGEIDGINRIWADAGGDSTADLAIYSNDQLYLSADEDGSSGGPYSCTISGSNGDFQCDGSKDWVHDIGNGKEAVYSAQESAEVRAVKEGSVEIKDGEATVEMPSHFTKTVSSERPSLKAQATPSELAQVAVTEKTRDSITIEASKDVKVDYRVTGIREGYEDKQVVRPKEEE